MVNGNLYMDMPFTSLIVLQIRTNGAMTNLFMNSRQTHEYLIEGLSIYLCIHTYMYMYIYSQCIGVYSPLFYMGLLPFEHPFISRLIARIYIVQFHEGMLASLMERSLEIN